jgi:YtxH-like protein
MFNPFNLSGGDLLATMGLQTRRSVAWYLLPLGLGVLAGAGLGLLLAPQTGRDTRQRIGKTATNVAGKLRAKLRERGNHHPRGGSSFEAEPLDTRH